MSINVLLTAALNSHVRERLKFKTNIPYNVLNKDIYKKWNWRSGLDSGQGFAGVAENLKSSMSMNKDLKVFIYLNSCSKGMQGTSNVWKTDHRHFKLRG